MIRSLWKESILYVAFLTRMVESYTCVGGTEIFNGNGGENHLNTWNQGGHTGKTAPCAIRKTYTAYEDHYLGDGGRGGSSANSFTDYPLFGGRTGLQCLNTGQCTGKDQDAPVQLLGTDSYGCCCSPGPVGLGLNIGEYAYTSAQSVLRFFECDTTLVKDSVQQAPCTGIEVCQFEITRMPSRGTMISVTPTGGKGYIYGNCSKDSPCVVQPYFNGFQPVNYNLVGSAGRFDTSKFFFQPFPGDVGECSTNDCFGLDANNYNREANQDMWKYSEVEFMVRTYTWKYQTDDNLLKEFSRTGQNRYVEVLEDAYKKMLYFNLTDLFFVEGCPCSFKPASAGTPSSFVCSAQKITSSCSDSSANAGGSGVLGGTKGRIMIIDLQRMRAVDGGIAVLCSSAQQGKCYTEALVTAMMAEVKSGCGTSTLGVQKPDCFVNLSCPNQCTGQSYPIFRPQTGVSDPANQTIRIVPYNDRPTVGGAGNSLKFDGIDDLIAATVDVFPQNAFTIMFWVRGHDSARKGQALLQLISPEVGIEVQIFNPENLEVVIHGYASGPTGIDVNSDLLWHHLAITWSSVEGLLSDITFFPAGRLFIYVDCNMTLDLANPRASQSTQFGGQAKYECAGGGASWAGILAAGEKISRNVEISFGQRLACNATTKVKREELQRQTLLNQSSAFCRRKSRTQCDPAFNQTASIFVPGIYKPQNDCVNTTSGIFLSRDNCSLNKSDPFSVTSHDTVHLQIALDWMTSNDVKPATGMQGSVYTIPVVKEEQIHQRVQCNCVSGCYDNIFAFLGQIDDVRVYNYTLSPREIAFVNGDGIRDGVNCDVAAVFIKVGYQEQRCSHMIDSIYKYGLTLYWPFDDPVDLYGIDSSLIRGEANLLSTFPSSFDVAQVQPNAIGNSGSGFKYAGRLGGGLASASPMLIPSTAPVRGGRYDFVQYARGTFQAVRLAIRDVDTCTNAADPFDISSDSFLPAYCDAIACPDSLCDLLRVVLSSTGNGAGSVFQTQVRSACRHPYSESLCAPFPECQGLLCFEHSSTPQQKDQLVPRLLAYTGAWVFEGTDQQRFDAGRQGVTFCDANSCSYTTFSMSQKASNIPSGRAGSYTYHSVKIQQGSTTEYRNIICHGGGRCDARTQSPDPGWVLTLDKPLSFIPISGRTLYWLYKAKYEPVWQIYYFSAALGGHGVASDRLAYDAYDAPGEAGTQLNANLASPQYLDAVTDPVSPSWNQPIRRTNIVMTPLNVPLVFPYNVTIAKGLSPAVIGIDLITDADPSKLGFNITVSGPQEIGLADNGIKHMSGNQSGDMFQAIEVHCGLIPESAKCSVIPAAQFIDPSHSKSELNITWCDDPTYVKSDSIMQILLDQHAFFRFGLISKLCTRNRNKTEIYNITAYNFSCLPPCVGTLYTFQEIADGCIRNCSQEGQEEDAICENTFGLYTNEYICIGGVYHGQPCMGLDDQGSCFDATNPTQAGFCANRDSAPGVSGPNLKALPGFNRLDPGLMVHGIHFGDVHFVDWLHRGARVVWNEVAVDVAVGLGYFDILKYLIQNGCPWRDSAIQVAKMRGRPMITAFLEALRPPLGTQDPLCGCARFFLHPVNPAIVRCFPHTELECYQTCSSDPDTDISCINGRSNYLGPNDTTATSIKESDNSIFLLAEQAPAVSRCTTGSSTALVRGPRIYFVSNTSKSPLRKWSGTNIGFASRIDICQRTIPGIPPIQVCFNRTLVQYGKFVEFWNYHLSDIRTRILYFPPPNATPGRLAKFTFTVSRMTQSPAQDQTGLDSSKRTLYSTPIAARETSVEIHVTNLNYRPELKNDVTTFILKEDQISVLTLRFKDSDTLAKDIRAYITQFPIHGELHQVLSSTRVLNSSFFSDETYGYGQELGCRTSAGDCTASGDCKEPIDSCYYIREDFVVGEAITQSESMMNQFPTAIFNSSSAIILPVRSNNTDNICWETDRFAEDSWWGGETFCDLTDLDYVAGNCRRCMSPSPVEEKLPPGHWSGRLILNPIYLQRHDGSKAIHAPNDAEQGGLCSLEEQCQVEGNTASKASCIQWPSLDANGHPTVNLRDLFALLNPTAPGYPCKGASDQSECARDIMYLWPPGYSPKLLSAQKLKLTNFGDPVDTESFYAQCGRSGVHQFKAEYSEQVFMHGFDLYSTMPDTIRLRVLAKTGRRMLSTRFVMREVLNSTSETEETDSTTKTSRTYSYTKRKERIQTTIYCGGQEWREVWRGFAYDGRASSEWSVNVLQGRSANDRHMKFRFAPLNFTTSELILEACGLMYNGPTNNDGGNPLESLEGLVLIGTKHTPMGLVTDEFFRIAYIPHPHFAGTDSFSVRGEDFQNVCRGVECQMRTELQESRINLMVQNVNDQPIAQSLEITAGAEEPITFTLNGVDASPDTTIGWQEFGALGQGAGGGSRFGVGPASEIYYTTSSSDPLGSPDQEPDSALTATILRYPDLGTLVAQGGRTFQYTPAVGSGGRPCTTIVYTLTDPQGLTSLPVNVNINILCNPGFFIDQPARLCRPCPIGHYKPITDDRTSCMKCDRGFFASKTNSTKCTACAVGSFAPTPGSAECEECRPGTYGDKLGMSMCPFCPPGKFSPRPSSTSCLDCGPLAYNPLAGIPRCYDCPYLSRSSLFTSSNVSNCICVHKSYRKAIFNANVSQRWSITGFATSNGSEVAPSVYAIERPWPLRLGQVSSNCTPCPEGGFCYGQNITPITKIGFWTDSASFEKEFWPNTITPQYYSCDSRNIRGVCMGYPMFYPQEQQEICRYRKNYGTCDLWPKFNYTTFPDPARCKAGYEGVICSQCISYALKQCIPSWSDGVDGWYSWATFTKYRAQMASGQRYVPNCYEIGGCDPSTDPSLCTERQEKCNELSGICRWDAKTYYRNFAGFCQECPLSIGPGFIIYVAWFAVYGTAIAILVMLYLSDMRSFCICIHFMQCAALVARFRLPWPPFALSLLSACSLTNVNLEALPWKCFFNVAPSYADFWFLTVFVPAAVMSGTIVWWIFPFLVIPPRGKVAINALKRVMKRRNDLLSNGSFVRSQYMTLRSDSRKSVLQPAEAGNDMSSVIQDTQVPAKVEGDIFSIDSAAEMDIQEGFADNRDSSLHDIPVHQEKIDESQPLARLDTANSGKISNRRPASRKMDDINLEDIGVDATLVSGGNFGNDNQTAQNEIDIASSNRFPRANASLRNSCETSLRNKLCDSSSQDTFECALPGSIQDVEPLSGDCKQIAGESFGSTFHYAGKYVIESVRSPSKRGLFNRGKSAVAAFENKDQHYTTSVASSESEHLIDPQACADDVFTESNNNFEPQASDGEPAQNTDGVSIGKGLSKLPVAEAPLTPSKRRRQDEGYREWSTQNITQSYTPRMEDRQDTARSTASSDEVYKPIGLPWYARRQYLDLAWRNCVGILDMMFVMASCKTLEVFQWKFLTANTAVLDADPNTRAFSSIHKGLISFAVLIFPVYVASPIISNGFIVWGWWYRKMDAQNFAMKWGFLLDSFERKVWYWNIFVSTRRFTFIVSSVFLNSAQYMQCFLPIFVLSVNIIANYIYRPYREERHNFLENILLLGLIVLLIVGNFAAENISLYHDTNGRELPGPYDDAMSFCVIAVLGIGFMACALCMYADMMVAQVRMPALIRYAYNVLILPVIILRHAVRQMVELARSLSKPSNPRGKGQANTTKQSKFQNATAFNRAACGDPPEVTGTRLIDVFWDSVKKMRRKKERTVLQDFDDHGVLIRPDDGANWLRDKFSIRKRIFLLEKALKLESTFDPKSALILRIERQLSTALDAVLEYHSREKDEFYDQLYDAKTENELLNLDYDVAKGKVMRQEEELSKVVRESNFARVKLDTEIRRVGQPEEWKRKFLSEQAIRHSLEQEIVDLQAQVDSIRLQQGGVWRENSAATEDR